ncbi:MAG: class I SAM-dependent methyltransferase [Gemmatimonadota bacterium]
MTDRYGQYVATQTYRDSRRRKAAVMAHLCREQLASAERVADLGAGTGIIRKELEVSAGKPILGFDIDKSFIVEKERMAVADVLELPVRSGDLDLVLLNHLYEHVGNQARLFEEAYRILRPGGWAYVTAGSRRAVMEPHYRLPFLSWLPAPAAAAYVRLSGRGEGYEDIKFLTYRPLVRLMRGAGFMIHDITERAIDDLIESAWGPIWARAWAPVRALPAEARRSALKALSPQWFFLLQKPATA